MKWADIGGLEDVKQQLQEAVIWPQQHADRLASVGDRVMSQLLTEMDGKCLPSNSCYSGIY